MAESVPVFAPSLAALSKLTELEQRQLATESCPVSTYQIPDPQRTIASTPGGN